MTWKWIAFATVILLAVSLAGTADARTRSFCSGRAERDCGRHKEPACTSGKACDSGYEEYSGDPFPITIDCPWPLSDSTVKSGCYDSDLLACDDCGGQGEYPCPSGLPCTAGCASGKQQAGLLCYSGCGAAGQTACSNNECYAGHLSVAGLCVACGGDLQPVCKDGTCNDGLENQGAYCAACGGAGQRHCLFGAPCRDGNRDIGPSEQTLHACGPCGGADSSLACWGIPCDAGYVHSRGDGLTHSIAQCEDKVEADQVHFVEQNGICAVAAPDPMLRPDPQDWPPVASPSQDRSTVIFIHGRNSSCADAVLNAGGLYGLGHRTYCLEYDQRERGDDRTRIWLYGVDGDDPGEPLQAPCHGDEDVACRWNTSSPEDERLVYEHTVKGVAFGLYQSLSRARTEGEITLVAHSQGGFIARQLVYRHYDELREAGLVITRVIFLGHPFFGPQMDAALYGPWACLDDGDGRIDGEASFDCATANWLAGWETEVLQNGRGIDDTDYPQIEWTWARGAGTLGAISADFGTEACIEVFGGVVTSTVLGDGTVPILSASGVDEFGFYSRPALAFDHQLVAGDCGHGADCLLADLVTRRPDVLPAHGAPPPPVLDVLVDAVANPDGSSPVTTDRDFAQQFTVGSAGTLAYADVGVQARPFSIVGLEWELLSMANGKPDSMAPLVSGFVPIGDFSGALEWIRLGPLDVPVEVGDELAIALYAPAGSPDAYDWHLWDDDYADGMRFCQGLCGEDWGFEQRTDMGIRTWVYAAPEPSASLLQLVSVGVLLLLRRGGLFGGIEIRRDRAPR